MMKIHIIVADITKLQVDAIVNAASSSLSGKNGVDKAVHIAAGKELTKECKKIGKCRTGKCVITNAYNLPCKKVIHTVGPTWHGGKEGEKELLASCYDSAFAFAKKYHLRSIAFPCISTGVLKYPKGKMAK